MQVDHKSLGVAVVGLSFIGLLVLMARQRTDNTGQPRYQDDASLASLSPMAIDALDTGAHYFHPNFCVPGQTQIWTQHRYPAVSGGNVSTLIHHGMSALRRPAPQDSDWIERPPAEVMF
jgi:hypothetical protein